MTSGISCSLCLVTHYEASHTVWRGTRVSGSEPQVLIDQKRGWPLLEQTGNRTLDRPQHSPDYPIPEQPVQANGVD